MQQGLTWEELTNLFMDSSKTVCTERDCQRAACPYKERSCWSPARFTGDRRRSDAVVEISSLVLDFDHESEEMLDALREKLSNYAYILHTTHSDRDDDRCVRIVVQLSRPIALREWSVFWSVVSFHFGHCHADAARCYYMPSRPSDAGYVVATNSGLPLDVNAILTSKQPVVAVVAEGSADNSTDDSEGGLHP
jgi:hypothetical protein